MGLSDLLIPNVVWNLDSLDTSAPLSIEGQFPATNLQENISGNWAEQSTLGLSQPLLQFVSGNLDTITCEVMVWAKHQGVIGTGLGADDIEETVNLIRRLPRVNPDLGRPMVYLFSIGTQFIRQVVVRSVGGIRYGRMRPKDGTLRQVIFTLDMAAYQPFDPASFTGEAAESLVTPAKDGDSYEHIANRVHGDATLGEALRRRNPERRRLTAGDLVHVPRASILRKEITPLTPASLFLQDGDAQRDLFNDTLAAHASDILSHVVLTDFTD